MQVTRSEDRWVVMGLLEVQQLSIDYAFTLALAGDLDVRIEQNFTLVSRDGSERVLSPEGDPEAMAPVLAVSRSTVSEIVAFDDGRLEISFIDGMRILVPMCEDYEAWTLVGADGLRIVSLTAGEGLAVWTPDNT
jgi:hypothetical protein